MLLLTLLQARASVSPLTSVNVAGCVVPFTDTVKILGVTIDHHLTFNTHVHNFCILQVVILPYSSTEAYSCTLVNSCLDYANRQWQTLRNYSTYRTCLPKLSHTRSELALPMLHMAAAADVCVGILPGYIACYSLLQRLQLALLVYIM